MNEHISTSDHAYIISYGMSRAPFNNDIVDDLFYPEPARQQKLDILHHLTQYGNELMLVLGPKNSGKTTLLQQFKLHALDTWKVARIEAKNGIDERKLVQQLFHQMNLEFHGATHAELLEHLEHHFDSLQHSARQAVMLIDDAEQLPVTALKCVLALAKLTSKDNKPLLRIVLFGNNQLNENFSDPLLDQYNSIVKRNIDLPAFDNEHTAHYILHRLSEAQFASDKPFTDGAMQKIHKQSNGWPGEINRLAHNLLIESAPSSSTSTTDKKQSTFNTPRAIAAAIGIVAISALLFFQNDFNHWIDNSATNNNDKTTGILPALTMKPLAIPPESPLENSTTIAKKTDSTIGTSKMLTTDDPAAILAQMHDDKEPSDEINTALQAVDEITENEIAPDLAAPTTTAAEQAATKVEPAHKSPSTPKTSPRVAKPVVNKSVAASKSELLASTIPVDLPGQRTDWILKQNPDHYTLQLVAGNNIKTLRAFIDRHPLPKPLAVYRSTRKNQPWFALVHGIFTSKQQAIDASNRLRKTLRRVKPWVRNLAPLQEELRKTSRVP